MDNEHYIDLMASQALQGLLASPLMINLSWEAIVEQSHNLAEMMWDEREKRRTARAAMLASQDASQEGKDG